MIKNLLRGLGFKPASGDMSATGNVAAYPLAVEPMARKAAPGERVHGEHFISGEAPNVQWLARVYGKNGELNEQSGVAASDLLARAAALEWRAPVEQALRGE